MRVGGKANLDSVKEVSRKLVDLKLLRSLKSVLCEEEAQTKT